VVKALAVHGRPVDGVVPEAAEGVIGPIPENHAGLPPHDVVPLLTPDNVVPLLAPHDVFSLPPHDVLVLATDDVLAAVGVALSPHDVVEVVLAPHDVFLPPDDVPLLTPDDVPWLPPEDVVIPGGEVQIRRVAEQHAVAPDHVLRPGD